MIEPHAPSYPMMPQQSQQQPHLDQNRTFLSQHSQDQSQQQLQQQQQQQHQMFDSVHGARGNMVSGSLGVSHSAGLMKQQGPTANINVMGGPTSTVGSMSSTMQTSVPSFSVAPQPMPVDGSTVTAHYGPSAPQQRSLHNYPTSGTSLPTSQVCTICLV